MLWSDYYTSLVTMLQVADASGQANFNLILQRLIDDAELFIFRHPKLDFLATRTTDRTQQTTAGLRSVPIPPAFVIIEDLALILPSGVQPNSPGAQRVPLLRVKRPFIDLIWPIESVTQTPAPFETYYAIYEQQELQTTLRPIPAQPVAGIALANSPALIAPTPDQNYVAEFRGTFRPTPFYTVAGFSPALTAATQFAQNNQATTFLSTWLPDLLLSASLFFGTAYQKNFGASGDDPRMAMSWYTHMMNQIDVAGSEEFRKKAQGWSWSAYPMPSAAEMPQPQLMQQRAA